MLRWQAGQQLRTPPPKPTAGLPLHHRQHHQHSTTSSTSSTAASSPSPSQSPSQRRHHGAPGDHRRLVAGSLSGCPPLPAAQVRAPTCQTRTPWHLRIPAVCRLSRCLPAPGVSLARRGCRQHWLLLLLLHAISSAGFPGTWPPSTDSQVTHRTSLAGAFVVGVAYGEAILHRASSLSRACVCACACVECESMRCTLCVRPCPSWPAAPVVYSAVIPLSVPAASSPPPFHRGQHRFLSLLRPRRAPPLPLHRSDVPARASHTVGQALAYACLALALCAARQCAPCPPACLQVTMDAG